MRTKEKIVIRADPFCNCLILIYTIWIIFGAYKNPLVYFKNDAVCPLKKIY